MSGSVSLSGRQRKFITALLTASTIEEAAKAAGISERTAYRYLKKPAVSKALEELAATIFDQVARRSSMAMSEALKTLEELTKNAEAAATTRLSAARIILDVGPKLREITDLAGRLADLEDRMGVDK